MQITFPGPDGQPIPVTDTRRDPIPGKQLDRRPASTIIAAMRSEERRPAGTLISTMRV